MFDNILEQEKDGFKFTRIVYPYNQPIAIQIEQGEHSIEDYIEYINKNKIEQARVIMPCVEFLNCCPSLKYLRIEQLYVDKPLDFSPLYKMKVIKHLSCNNEVSIVNNKEIKKFNTIDYSKIKGLESLQVSQLPNHKNYTNISTLKSLSISAYLNNDKNLKGMFSSKILDTLEMILCKEESLDGIETSEKLQCLYIYYNRSLNDISALRNVKKTLKALKIEHCSKVNDFSVLEELENLEYLQIIGNNVLPDIQFIKKLKKLKTFMFDVNILDGDLTPCLSLNYVACLKYKKHYNVKRSLLPNDKNKIVRGNENIEEWRRLL